MKDLLYALGKRAAPTVLKSRWIYRSLTGTESEKTQAEYTMGCYLASLQIRQAKLVRDPETADLLTTLTERLSLTLVNRERKFQTRCLENPEPNAFALPGGFLFVTRSLLEMCGRDPDEVAFVIAHEMAHVLRSHSVNRLLTSEVMQLLARGAPLQGTMNPAVRQLVHQLVTQGYSRRQEFEADRVALKIVRVAGYSPNGALRMFERLQRLSNEPDALGTYFSSHPPVSARMQRIQRAIAE